MSKKRRILFTICGCFFCILLGSCDWVGTLSQKEIRKTCDYVIADMEQAEWEYRMNFNVEHQGNYGLFGVGVHGDWYYCELDIEKQCHMLFLEDCFYVDDKQTGQHYKFLYSFDYSSYTFLEDYPSLIAETLKDKKNEFTGTYDATSLLKKGWRYLFWDLDPEERQQFRFRSEVTTADIGIYLRSAEKISFVALGFDQSEGLSGVLRMRPASQPESYDHASTFDLPFRDYPLCEDPEKLDGYLALLPQIDMRDFFLLSDEAEAE